jgi:hypothetical protein
VAPGSERGRFALPQKLSRSAVRVARAPDRVRREGRFPRVADRTAAIRAVISGTTAQGDVRAWIDVMMLARSRAHVQLVVGSVFTPPARADELRLARVLAGRMARATRS